MSLSTSVGVKFWKIRDKNAAARRHPGVWRRHLDGGVLLVLNESVHLDLSSVELLSVTVVELHNQI